MKARNNSRKRELDRKTASFTLSLIGYCTPTSFTLRAFLDDSIAWLSSYAGGVKVGDGWVGVIKDKEKKEKVARRGNKHIGKVGRM